MRWNVSQLPGGELLSAYLPGTFSLEEGSSLQGHCVERSGYRLRPGTAAGGVIIEYAGLSDLMMALGDLITEGPPTAVREQAPALEFRAVMLDCSRNGVPTEGFLKGAILRLALMGMNAFCLYTEDTYVVAGEPLFGHGRGAYTRNELRELAKFAAGLGVTMFPCIQTLGHLEQVLKYQHYHWLRDTEQVLNAELEEAAEFLDRLIANAAEPYDTPYIHVGMDEAWGIGRGRAFREGEPIRPLAIYARHVARVAELCRRRGLQPIMWGDFIIGHSGERPLAADEQALLPRDMIMNYWNYGQREVAPHLAAIATYRAMGYEPVVSPGLHNWNRFWPDFATARATIEPCLRAVHQAGVKMAMLTMWGDDGQECLFDLNYPALACFLAWCREADPPEAVWLRRCERIAGMPAAALLAIAKLEQAVPASTMPEGLAISAKMLFYDDPLMAQVERQCRDEAPAAAFAARADELATWALRSGAAAELVRLAEIFARIVAAKFMLSRRCRSAYLAGAPGELQEALAAVPALAADLAEFHDHYLRLWRHERKPFGSEVMDLRLGGLRARLETFRRTVQAYLDGEEETIPEFDLPDPPELQTGDFLFWRRIVTRCLMQ